VRLTQTNQCVERTAPQVHITMQMAVLAQVGQVLIRLQRTERVGPVRPDAEARRRPYRELSPQQPAGCEATAIRQPRLIIERLAVPGDSSVDPPVRCPSLRMCFTGREPREQ